MKINKSAVFVGMMLCCFLLKNAAAEETEEWATEKAKLGHTIQQDKEISLISDIWKGEAELGLVKTTGNTDTQTLNGKIDVTREFQIWRHNGHFEILKSSDKDETSAEKYLISAKSDRKFNEYDYLFALGMYEDERFSGFDNQITLSAGYGRKFILSDNIKSDLEVGAGFRKSELESEEARNEGLISLAGVLDWKLSETSDFQQMLSSYIGEDTTISKSVTSLKIRIVGNLAAKLSYTIRHTSSVPEDTDKLDTEFAVTLVFSL